MHFLTKTALKRPVSVLMIVLALLIFGFGAMFTTPMELMPEIEMPMMMVMTFYPGAAPEDVEEQVTSKMEDAASTLGGVKNIYSMSSENVSILQLEMEYGTDMDEAHSDLKNNIDLQKNSLPADVSDPMVIEMNMDMMPVISLSARATGDVDLKYYIEEEIVPEIEKLGGVASVNVSGGQSDYIKVELIEERMNQFHLDMSTLSSLIAAADFSLPAGSVAQGNLDLILRGGVSYYTAADLGTLPLTLPSGDIIHLSDVAKIHNAKQEKDSLNRYNGEETVGISASKRQSASTFAVTRAVKKEVERINSSNMGVQIDIIHDSSEQILASILSVVQTLIGGILLAMLVLFWFLGDWRASLIVGSSIPLSLLITLIAMNFMGFSFNILSLGGLVIGVGMMVDNSIVVIESCFRLKDAKASFYDAALEGTRVVGASVVASTITTVVVFLPMAMIKGMSGQMFGQLCFTIVFSLIASLISALTIVPLTFCRLEPVQNETAFTQKWMDKISMAYADFLPKTFARKKTMVTVSVLLLVGSLLLVPFIGVELIPESDEGTVEVTFTARPGLSLAALDEKIIPIEELVAAHPDVDRYSMRAGGSQAVLMGGTGSATLTAYLKEDRKLSTKEVISEWREALGEVVDCDISFSSSSTTMMMTGGSDIQINIQGTDLAALEEWNDPLEAAIRENPYVLRTSSTITSGNPQAEINIDPVKASALGIIPKQAMGEIYSIMQGKEAATLMQNGKEYKVRVEYPDDRFRSVTDLTSLSVHNANGLAVPLLDIATIEYSNSPLTISRQNGRYVVTVTAEKSFDAPSDLARTLTAAAKTLEFPAGVEVVESAQDEQMAEEFSALFGAIGTAVFLVFMVMAMQFESPRFSIVVMICVPFALVGSFLCLFLFGCSISMPSLMGFLMLSGIVVNNGILFIDTTNIFRKEQKLSAEDALLTAGMLRMRPIFMTTLTTILAMVPMAMGIGENGALMKGMAFVIIGGLIASTMLTLLLLPTFYLLTDPTAVKARKEERKARRAARRLKAE